MVENGNIVSSRSSIGTIGNAVIGGAIGGGIGAIIGSNSTSTISEQTISSISVNIRIKDINNPSLSIAIHSGYSLKRDDEAYKQDILIAKNINDTIYAIIYKYNTN